MLVKPALMQDQFGSAAMAVGNESDPRIDDFEKVIAFALGEYLEFGLPSRLHEKMIAFLRNANDEVRGQLIASYIAPEHLRVYLDFLSLRREDNFFAVGQGRQFSRDFAWGPSIQIAQHNDRQLVFRVVRQLSIEALNPTPMLDNLATIHGTHIEPERVVVLEWRRHLLERRRRK